jgi:hypothetical protein
MQSHYAASGRALHLRAPHAGSGIWTNDPNWIGAGTVVQHDAGCKVKRINTVETAQVTDVSTGAALGANVIDVDRSEPITGAVFSRIGAARHTHRVLRLRDQHLDDPALLACGSGTVAEVGGSPGRFDVAIP